MSDSDQGDRVRTYAVADCWVVSDNGVWLEGSYATESAARRAASFSDKVLADLGRIYRVDGENRPVTDADLDAAAAGQ